MAGRRWVWILIVLFILFSYVISNGVELIVDRSPPGVAPAEISPWLLVCAFFLALFLAIGKRRHELALLEGEAARHRSAPAAWRCPRPSARRSLRGSCGCR